jgi:hypothetical protein
MPPPPVAKGDPAICVKTPLEFAENPEIVLAAGMSLLEYTNLDCASRPLTSAKSAVSFTEKLSGTIIGSPVGITVQHGFTSETILIQLRT